MMVKIGDHWISPDHIAAVESYRGAARIRLTSGHVLAAKGTPDEIITAIRDKLEWSDDSHEW